jgi:hypothetical protein
MDATEPQISEVQARPPETFKAKVRVFVNILVDVEPEGSGDLTLRQAKVRAAAAAYEKIRDAGFGGYNVERPPVVEVEA